MKATIRIQGIQLTVSVGDVVEVNRYKDTNDGDTVTIEDVLAVGDGAEMRFGTPVVAGAKVTGTIVENKRGKKIVVLKKKRRQGYRLKQGHRQELSVLKIDAIDA